MIRKQLQRNPDHWLGKKVFILSTIPFFLVDMYICKVNLYTLVIKDVEEFTVQINAVIEMFHNLVTDIGE